MAARHIAFWGKRWVGTSTLVANLGVAMAEAGVRVLLVGQGGGRCATALVHGEGKPEPLLAYTGRQFPGVSDNLVVRGFMGVHCVDLGAPRQDGETAVRKVAEALSILHELRLAERLHVDVVIYDLPVEIAAMGGIVPLPESSYLVYAVTSADFAAITAANDILREFNGDKRAQIGGIIANLLHGPFGEAMVNDYARQVGTEVLAHIPRSLVSIQTGLYGRTVLECAPLANQAYVYRKLARRIMETKDPAPVLPLDDHILQKWGREWGELLLELESGIVRDGASI